jgi:hypothetical protein
MWKILKDIVKNDKVRATGAIVGKVGKAIVIEGVKGVLLKSAATVITTSFESGMTGVKKLTVDDYVVGKKRSLFGVPEVKSKPKEAKVIIEGDFEVVDKRDQES